MTALAYPNPSCCCSAVTPARRQLLQRFRDNSDAALQFPQGSAPQGRGAGFGRRQQAQNQGFGGFANPQQGGSGFATPQQQSFTVPQQQGVQPGWFWPPSTARCFPTRRPTDYPPAGRWRRFWSRLQSGWVRPSSTKPRPE